MRLVEDVAGYRARVLRLSQSLLANQRARGRQAGQLRESTQNRDGKRHFLKGVWMKQTA